MRRWVLVLSVGIALAGCAGNPLETNNLTKDGRVYHETEDIGADGETRSTIKVQGATF